jgi:hypothetical protein
MQLCTMRAKKQFERVSAFADAHPKDELVRLAVTELRRNLETLGVILSGEHAVASLANEVLEEVVEG